ncbi:MAG: sugar phosphate isomerase/epimerase [Methylacidiphilales bacterium]|nr:sugar phosphate isomerase/epimerase [Candidatus Methylacidiphilales bacterium]
MQYGFSSIGYPEASLSEMASLALEFGLDFIELRALGGTIDLPGYFAAVDATPPVGPGVRLVATSLHLTEATGEDIDTFLRFVDVATALRAPYVRVFGGGDSLPDSAMDQAAQTVRRCRSLMRERSAACEILIETHSSFSSPAACLRLNQRLDEPVLVLWDSHHTWRIAGESPAQTWRQIGPLVRHIHFNDSQSQKAGAKYKCVLPGAGEYPVEALRRLLSQEHYSHGISLEWEKLWHPELPDVRQALKEFKPLFEFGPECHK